LAGYLSIGLLLAALQAGTLGPPDPVFFDFPPAPPPPVTQACPAPESLSRHGRRQAAYLRLVSFIREEKFSDALQFIYKQSQDTRAWSGLAALEAGLLSVADPQKSLALYDRILQSDNRDRHWVRALAGYRVLLKNMSDKGDYLARARLVRLLASEWRNDEARMFLEEMLKEAALPEAVRSDLESFRAVLALRVGDFKTAEDYWQAKSDINSRRYLATLYLRQGRSAEAADIRTQVAGLLKGRSKLREQGRVFDILAKGGLTGRAEKLLSDEPELKKSQGSWSFYLGLSCLVGRNPEKALSYFQAEENRPGIQGTRALYFKGRALELLQRFSEASAVYQKARSRPPGYYQILAAGRYDFLNDLPGPGPSHEAMAKLLKSPVGNLGASDRSSMGFYLWLSDKVPWPWPNLSETKSARAGVGEGARTRASIDHYLAYGDLSQALGELLAAYDAITPKKPEDLTPDLARWILLSAYGGDYRLALRLLAKVKTRAGSDFRTWSHPAVYGEEILKAYRLYGLPPQLVLSLIRTESAFQADAVSVSNARGLMQLLPSTAKSIARILGEPEPREEELFEPGLNIRYGTWYLNELIKAFGNYPLALAAYNGGPFNIKSYFLARGTIPLDIFLETLPLPETIRYVQAVLESQFIYEAAYLSGGRSPNLADPVSGPLPGEPPPF
jgi:hypothetical protein